MAKNKKRKKEAVKLKTLKEDETRAIEKLDSQFVLENKALPKVNVKNTNVALNVFLTLSIIVILAWLLIIMKVVLLPIVLAVIIAFLLEPMVTYLVSKKIPRLISVIVVWSFAALVSFLLGLFLIDVLTSFNDNFPQKYGNRIEQVVSDVKAFKDLKLSFITTEQIKNVLGRISLGNIVGGILGSLVNFLGYFILTLMFAAYFLPALESLPKRLKSAFKGARGESLSSAVIAIRRQIQSYMWAKILTSVITGVLVSISCFIFGVEFAIVWGVFAAFLNFVPNIGAILACAFPFAICWLQYGGVRPFWFLGVLIIVSMFTGNWMEPKILGKSVNLSPIASLIALFFWGWLWGAMGMIIALPATAMIKFTCDHIESLKPIGILLGNPD